VTPAEDLQVALAAMMRARECLEASLDLYLDVSASALAFADAVRTYRKALQSAAGAAKVRQGSARARRRNIMPPDSL
jgi:hypothetical protein